MTTTLPKAWVATFENKIVNWSINRPKRRNLRSPHFWTIAVLFTGFTIIYYSKEIGLARYLPGCSGFFTTVHDLHRGLFFIPIIYASLIFHLRGGLITCSLFLMVMLPRALFFSPYPHPLARALVFFAPATLISLLIISLLDQIERTQKVHEELVESTELLEEKQEQLFHAEKLGSLGQMAASIAHEINNPLTGVLVYTKLLKKKLGQEGLSPKIAVDYLSKMASEIDRSSRIIRNLLDFARPSALSLGDVDVNQVIGDAFTLVGHRAELGQVEIIRDLDPALPKVYADYDQLRQVFVNLTLNAIQATPAGGRVVLRTRALDDNALCVEVEDTGSGIPKEKRKNLFTPFFTTKEKGQGVGLGLAVARGIIEKHGGNIDFKSEEGKGTTFFLRLPVRESPEKASGT